MLRIVITLVSKLKPIQIFFLKMCHLFDIKILRYIIRFKQQKKLCYAMKRDFGDFCLKMSNVPADNVLLYSYIFSVQEIIFSSVSGEFFIMKIELVCIIQSQKIKIHPWCAGKCTTCNMNSPRRFSQSIKLMDCQLFNRCWLIVLLS